MSNHGAKLLRDSAVRVLENAGFWASVLSDCTWLEADILMHLSDKAVNISKALDKDARASTSNTFDKMIDESLKKGAGWLHKWAKGDTAKVETQTVLSELTVTGLSSETTTSEVRQIFQKCGSLQAVRVRDQVATLFFDDDSSRRNRTNHTR